MFFIWLLVVILLTLVEVMTVNLTTIWFVASGIVAIFVSMITDNFIIQLGIFTVLGIVLLITTKPFLQKRLVTNKQATNLDRVVGMTGIVTIPISKNNSGEVKVDGKLWTAISKDNLKKGDFIKVINMEGVKLTVRKEEEK